MGSIYDWSTTAADNATADDGLTWAEGQAPSTVNNSARVMMERVAEYLSDLSGAAVTTNTGNTYALSSSSAVTAYISGFRLLFRSSATNTGSATLNVNGVGAKLIVKVTTAGETALSGKELLGGGLYEAVYSTQINSGAGGWLLLNPTENGGTIPVGGMLDYAGSTAPDSYLFCYGQALSRTAYADLYAVLGTFYGSGDGSTTFNVPDKRGRVTAGKDDMGGTSANRLTGQTGGLNGDNLGAVGGEEAHQLLINETPAHGAAHGNFPTQVAVERTGWGTSGVGANQWPSGQMIVGTGQAEQVEGLESIAAAGNDRTFALSGATAVSSVGGDGTHNNVQPTIILNTIIRYR